MTPETPAEEENVPSASRSQPGRPTLPQKISERWRNSSWNRKNRAGNSPAPATANNQLDPNGARSSTRSPSPGDGLAQRKRTGGGRAAAASTQDKRLVTLAAPNENEPSGVRPSRSLPLTSDEQRVATSAHQAPAVASALPRSLPSVPSVPSDSRTQASSAADEPSHQPPEWPNRPLSAMARQSGTSAVPRPASLNPVPDATDPGREPIRLVNPPLLRTPPTDGSLETRSAADQRLAIPRILVCRQVRGFEDVVPLNPGRLRCGQPLLIYATLENFRSMATSKGFRTLTLSTLEIRTADGDLRQRQSLGTAVDLVETPRRDFFLTHLVTIPDDLPPGDYLFDLFVDDLLKHESANARIAVRVMEDRSPRDGTADISKFAARPAGSLR